MFTETLFIIVKSWEQLNVYKWEDKYHCGISLKQNPIQELKKKKEYTVESLSNLNESQKTLSWAKGTRYKTAHGI